MLITSINCNFLIQTLKWVILNNHLIKLIGLEFPDLLFTNIFILNIALLFVTAIIELIIFGTSNLIDFVIGSQSGAFHIFFFFIKKNLIQQ